MIKIKRVYDKIDESDALRILIDRLWPRGLSKEKVKIDLWLKDIAPNNDLRKWYAHDPKKWDEFKKKYFKELNSQKDPVDLIIQKSKRGNVTLLYSAKDKKFNNAAALKEYIETKVKVVK
jgi:uncharacterized protein YeaO (DUF488 family)